MTGFLTHSLQVDSIQDRDCVVTSPLLYHHCPPTPCTNLYLKSREIVEVARAMSVYSMYEPLTSDPEDSTHGEIHVGQQTSLACPADTPDPCARGEVDTVIALVLCIGGRVMLPLHDSAITPRSLCQKQGCYC